MADFIRVRRKRELVPNSPASLIAEAERLERKAEERKAEALRLLKKPIAERPTRQILRAWCQHLDCKKEARNIRLRASMV